MSDIQISSHGGGGGSTLTDSASLRATLSDEVGTGLAVFATSPTFTTGLTTPVVTITQGTIIADAPQIDGSVTWNNAGIVGPAWKLNVTDTTSNAAALLVDLQIATVSKWKVSKTGAVTQTGILTLPAGVLTSGSEAIRFSGLTGGIYATASSIAYGFAGTSKFSFFSDASLYLSDNAGGLHLGASIDVALRRDAANHHAWRNGTNAQRGSIYNSFISSTNLERLDFDWITTSNLARIMTVKGSGGGTARGMAIGTDSTNRITIDALGNVAMNGENAAMATTATDGYLSIPTCAGAPTGVPTAKTGAVQLHYDITNDKLWVYNGGWKSPKTPAAAAVITWQ